MSHHVAAFLGIALVFLSPRYLFLIPALYAHGLLLFSSVRAVARRKGVRFSAQLPTRTALGALPLILLFQEDRPAVPLVLAVLLISALPVLEPFAIRHLRGRRFRAANLPGIDVGNEPKVTSSLVLLVNQFCVLLATFAAFANLDALLVALCPLPGLLLMATAVIDTLKRVRASVAADNSLYDVIVSYSPKFILYYGVKTGTEYQVGMWIEYLERIGEPFLVVLRNITTFPTISRMTKAPVVVRSTMRQLDDVVVPSVKVAFYVNNSALNTHLVRYPEICHIQLLHGDSDKSTSFNPITAMYDKIFVAGQAGIDRYADNGIDIPLSKFEIVGRPQVESIEVAREHGDIRTVLYAPTWQGHFADTNYSSLSMAFGVIHDLAVRGIRIIFRPHPYSYRDEVSRQHIGAIHDALRTSREQGGPDHVWGARAESDLTIFDCFNESDALISDVSSVVPDYLYSRKPFALFSTIGSQEEFETGFPLAKAAYLVKPNESLAGDLLELLQEDPKAAVRDVMRKHYLGPVEEEQYADVFVKTSRTLVNRA